MSSNYGKFSPIALMKEKKQWPPFKPDTEGWYKWLDEQKEILREGYTVGGTRITGEHYGFLNFAHIGISNKNNSKVPTLPWLSDAQKEFFDTYEDIKTTGEDLLGLKTRGKGWTYQVAWLAIYKTHFVDFSETVGLFPGGTSTAKSNFTKAFEMIENELLFDFKWPRLKSNLEAKYISQVRYGVEVEQMNPNTGEPSGIIRTEGPQSSLTNIVVTDPSVVRSGRCQLLFIEEFGEMGVDGNAWDAKDVIGVARELLKEGSKSLGPILCGGTSNQFSNGFMAFKEMYMDGKNSFRKLWIPGNKSFWHFTDKKTGESDLEGAKKFILKERENLSGRDLIIRKQEMALTIEEALDEGGVNSVFDREKCNIQINRILTDPAFNGLVQKGNLHCKRKAGVITKEDIVFEEHPNGKFQIYKRPTKLKYPIVIATDSYKLAQSSDGKDMSKGACEGYVPNQGINTPGDYPAFIYLARPKIKDEFFMDTMLATIWYGTENLIEYTDEDIINFYKIRNCHHLLKKRPRIKEATWSKAENPYGILPTPHNKGIALEYALEKFETNYDQIVFVDLLREMIKFAPARDGTKKVNSDVVDAHNWAVLHSIDNIKILEDYQKPKREKGFSPYYASSGGGKGKWVMSKKDEQKAGIAPISNGIIPDKVQKFIDKTKP